MAIVREYPQIAGLNLCISRVEKGFCFYRSVLAGFYGSSGAGGFVTERCETLEEAEKKLGRYVQKELDKMVGNLERQLARVNEVRSGVQAKARDNPNWLAKYKED